MRIKTFCWVILSLFTFGTQPVVGQSNISISGNYQRGIVFQTNDFLKGYNSDKQRINSFESFSFSIAKKTTGINLWEHLFNLPTIGIGLQVNNFFTKKELGIPFGIYGFFRAPLINKQKNFSINYEIGFGGSFNWKGYHPIANKYNKAIGAKMAFMIKAGLELLYRIGNIELTTGFSFMHFSNGALKNPNLGINTFAPQIGMNYRILRTQEFEPQKIPSFLRKNEVLISVFAGIKNITPDSLNIDVIEKAEGINFPIFGLEFLLQKSISHKSKIGLGYSLSYNSSVNPRIFVEENELELILGSIFENFQASIFASYEISINRVSLVLQPACYIYRNKLNKSTPRFYQKIGLKYQIDSKLFLGLILRDYDFHVSDFIQWTIGYELK